MGRRKKLSVLEALDGNPTKKLIQASKIEAVGGPFVAAHLMDDAKACVEVIKQSMPEGVYAKLDSFLIAAFAVAWAIHKRAATEMAKQSFRWFVIVERGTRINQVPSPWIKIASSQAMLMASLGDRLGLDPKSRAHLTPLSERKKSSKFGDLISERPTAGDGELTASLPSSRN